MNGIGMGSEALRKSEEAVMELEAAEMFKATSGPAEIYTTMQTLNFWPRKGGWIIEIEDGTQHHVQEIYCNVSSATRIDKEASPKFFMVATGRLTISSGVAYVDVG